jgi:hypothetical protein
VKTNAAPKQEKKKFGFTSLFPVKSEEEPVMAAPPAPESLAVRPLPAALAPVPPPPAPAAVAPAAPRAIVPTAPVEPQVAPVVEAALETELGSSYKRAEALTDGRKRKRQNMIMRPDYLAALRLLGEYRNSSLSQVNEQAIGAYLELFKDELQKAKDWHAAKGLPPGAASA